MTIQLIVEGHGDVSAVPVLVRRLRDKAGAFEIDVGRPIRRRRWEFAKEDTLRGAVRIALRRSECSAILVVFDSDEDCPKELAPNVESWAKAEAGMIPCAVVMAHREYEAWFLASIESLKGKRGIREDAESHPDPEQPRGAKEHLEKRMVTGRSYSETADQAPLTELFDMSAAYARCRSFRHMASAFGKVVKAIGVSLESWPPSSWKVEGEA